MSVKVAPADLRIEDFASWTRRGQRMVPPFGTPLYCFVKGGVIELEVVGSKHIKSKFCDAGGMSNFQILVKSGERHYVGPISSMACLLGQRREWGSGFVVSFDRLGSGVESDFTKCLLDTDRSVIRLKQNPEKHGQTEGYKSGSSIGIPLQTLPPVIPQKIEYELTRAYELCDTDVIFSLLVNAKRKGTPPPFPVLQDDVETDDFLTHPMKELSPTGGTDGKVVQRECGRALLRIADGVIFGYTPSTGNDSEDCINCFRKAAAELNTDEPILMACMNKTMLLKRIVREMVCRVTIED